MRIFMLISTNDISWEIKNLGQIITIMFQEKIEVRDILLLRTNIMSEREKENILQQYELLNNEIVAKHISSEYEQSIYNTILKNHEEFCLNLYWAILKNTQKDLENYEKSTAQEIITNYSF